MSKVRARNISMDDLTREVSNMNISSGLSGLSPEEFERLKKDKIAIITIGRWQPPHAGHLELIDGTYEKVTKFKEVGFKGADGYIWIAPRPNKKIGNLINKNPLYLIDKWIYLNYMLPFDHYEDNLKFLHITNIDNDINQKVFRDDEDNASFLTAKHNLRENVSEDQLSECQAIKYNLLFKYGKENYQEFKQRTVKVNVRNQRVSASATCIDFLKNRGYKKLLLLVGSDRVEAFQRFNQEHLEQAFGAGNGIIEQIGADRGSAGNGLLFDLGQESGDEKEADLAANVMNYCSIQGCEQPEVEEEKSRSRSESIAGTFSGTRIRDCAYKLENLDYFCEGTMIGDMTKELSICLLNDLRKRHEPTLAPITKREWNEKVSSKYQFFGLNITHDEQFARLSLAQHGFFGRGGRKRKTRRKKGKGTIFSRRRNRENTSNVGKEIKDDKGFLWTIIREENGNVFIIKNSSGSGGTKKRLPDGLLEPSFMGPVLISALEDAGWGLEKSGSVPGGTQSGGKRKTRKRGRVPIKYVPKRLTRKDKKKARRELKKSRKAYKKGKYYTRKKVKSFKSKKSNHIINAMKIYGVKSVSASPKLAKKSGCSVTGLKKLVSKGAGAYYSSGSRPNQTAISWGRARMASAITGGKAAAVDFKILEKYCKPSSKALKLAKQAKKKHGYGTRKVRKVKL